MSRCIVIVQLRPSLHLSYYCDTCASNQIVKQEPLYLLLIRYVDQF
jgi:hypothetical protein